ncbi:hypothetical protein AVEN_243902-1 [Araneus ventricosus]|uniref:Uncharacterized protein n=1 Tax=Araneus ventricosus TaxID=182803 RepID=A0A4Y2PSH9_ARAVE|nr:hypothetical protein AVEN_243902-1 [Araneus ventricosus]
MYQELKKGAFSMRRVPQAVILASTNRARYCLNKVIRHDLCGLHLQITFYPQRNITYERQRLFLLVQWEVQSVNVFLPELRKQLRNCDYGSLSDSVLVDRLVRGLLESRPRERLLRVPDLDIKKAVDMCRAAETSKLQAQVYFTEKRCIDAIKRLKTSLEVKPRTTGQANKF